MSKQYTDLNILTGAYDINLSSTGISIDDGTVTPSYLLDVSDSVGRFYFDSQNAVGPAIGAFTSDTSKRTILAALNDTTAISFGQIGLTDVSSSGYGAPGDSYIYSSAASNGLNIISQPGVGTQDYIRLYGGGNPSATIASIHIQGSGSTLGYVGIGTETPSDILEVVQGTSKFVTDLNSSNGPLINVTTTNTNSLISFAAGDGTSIMTVGTVGTGWAGSTGFGQPGDSYVYSNSSANGLNIISAPGTGTEDYIRFYAGDNALSTAHLHIQGDGATTGYVGIGTETPDANLSVLGSSAGDVVFKVDGTAGELFTITDSLTGVLFAVNNISGLPILEVEDTDEVRIGNYQAPAGYTTRIVEITSTGDTDIHAVDMLTYDMATFDYVIKDGTNFRAGTIVSTWDGVNVEFTETSTNDIGDTTDIVFNFNITTAGEAVLYTTAASTGWTIKTIIRTI